MLRSIVFAMTLCLIQMATAPPARPSKQPTQVQSTIRYFFKDQATPKVTQNAFYPNWIQYKGLFDINPSPSEEQQAKKNYLLNVMFFIEDSFQQFNHSYRVTNTSHQSFQRAAQQKSYKYPIPTFQQFVKQYNKTYKTPQDRAYRQKVFNSNVATLPVITYYSDLTTDEFENSILPANIIRAEDKSKQLVNYMLLVRRNQTEQGSKFSNTTKIMDVNIQNVSNSIVRNLDESVKPFPLSKLTSNQNNTVNKRPLTQVTPRRTSAAQNTGVYRSQKFKLNPKTNSYVKIQDRIGYQPSMPLLPSFQNPNTLPVPPYTTSPKTQTPSPTQYVPTTNTKPFQTLPTLTPKYPTPVPQYPTLTPQYPTPQYPTPVPQYTPPTPQLGSSLYNTYSTYGGLSPVPIPVISP